MYKIECVCKNCGISTFLSGYRMESAKTISCIHCNKRTITAYGLKLIERIKNKGEKK